MYIAEMQSLEQIAVSYLKWPAFICPLSAVEVLRMSFGQEESVFIMRCYEVMNL